MPQFPYLRSGDPLEDLMAEHLYMGADVLTVVFVGCRHHQYGMEPGREAAGGGHPGWHRGCVGYGRAAGDPHPNWTHR